MRSIVYTIISLIILVIGVSGYHYGQELYKSHIYYPTEDVVKATYLLRGQFVLSHDEEEGSTRVQGNSSTAFHIGDGYWLSAEHNLRRVTNPLRSRFAIFDGDDGQHNVTIEWESSEFDVMMIKTKYVPNYKITIDCDVSLSIDDHIRAVGNPINLRSQVTYGRVGNLMYNDDRRAAGGRTWAYTQTFSIPVREGMSGGPIVNDQGNLVGIIVGSSVPFTTAVPVDKVCELMEENESER